MAKAHDDHNIPSEVREAIKQFLAAAHKEKEPFAVSEALGAVRRVFPDLSVSDSELMDAIASEASVAGFEIDYDGEQEPKTIRRKALERWDDEGGAIGRNGRSQ
ncbi:hypothetical protein [Chelativorans sp. M5D2P16]|uniref:hypothetical protein n=1 Tax=Chelativorans sp. M5D2P16 TaxID=3095678 RepID=UPI002ACA733B|nr:hypothetical protein [Chelativorans sp. M5D2P16]MDZ5697638.1 hypothetical protein [Chelativorans sp. M5D2P16]